MGASMDGTKCKNCKEPLVDEAEIETGICEDCHADIDCMDLEDQFDHYWSLA